jgi:hypothetical protein
VAEVLVTVGLTLGSPVCGGDGNVDSSTAPVVPVFVGGHPELDACSSAGRPRGLKSDGDGFLAVRSGPGVQYEITDKLHPGETFSLCDVSPDQRWHGIVYGDSAEHDCGVSSPKAAQVPYRGPCKSGWVNVKFVEVHAG